MPRKIRGLFAPLTQELGYDPRFFELSDLEKLLYVLVLYTAHMTNNSAPSDPRYYRLKYGLRSRSHQVSSALETIKLRFPKLIGTDKILSFVNMPTYENSLVPKKSVDKELDKEQEQEQEVNVPFKNDSFKNWNKLKDEFPNKASITKAMRLFFEHETINFEDLMKAVKNYKKHLIANSWKKPMNLERFLNEFDSWINYHETEKEMTDDEQARAAIERIRTRGVEKNHA